jgi:predicted CXXCH cytochrome family protein
LGATALALSLLGVGWLAAAPGDPSSIMPRGGKELCLVCHDEFHVELEGRVVHAPVAEDRCTACHNPHASRHANLLDESGDSLCLDCHDTLRAEMDRLVRHGALKDAQGCVRCHDPHASGHGAILADAPEILCGSCHERIAGQIGLARPHAPAAAGDCGTCHLPHGGTESALLTGTPNQLCRECHDLDAIQVEHKEFALGEADCSSCHDPHGAGAPGLLRETVHAPFEDCETCHESAAQPRQLTSALPGLCVDCHEESLAEPSAANHPADGEVRCVDCHSPHAGLDPGIVRGPERQVCLRCHVKIRRTIDRSVSSHPWRVEDGRCTACHQPHDAPDSPLLAKARSELCAGCHETHSRFTHPMGPNVPDPSRPGKTVDCLSCHAPHASDQKMMLWASEDRELCIRCHQEWGG